MFRYFQIFLRDQMGKTIVEDDSAAAFKIKERITDAENHVRQLIKDSHAELSLNQYFHSKDISDSVESALRALMTDG